MDNVSGDESFQGIQMVERVVYVIGMRQTGKKYPQIKYGKIYKTETHLYSSDNIVYGEGHGGWVLRYPLRELSRIELLVELHKQKINIEYVGRLP